MEQVLQYIRDNRELLLYLFLGVLILIVLIYFIRAISSSKKPKPTSSTALDRSTAYMAKPLTPSQPVSHEQVEAYTEKIKSLSLEARAIIEFLDSEVADRSQRVSEKTRYIEQLTQQEFELQENIKKLDSLPPEVAAKMGEERIRELEGQLRNTRLRMLMLGFFLGLLIAGAGGMGYYYYAYGQLPL